MAGNQLKAAWAKPILRRFEMTEELMGKLFSASGAAVELPLKPRNQT